MSTRHAHTATHWVTEAQACTPYAAMHHVTGYAPLNMHSTTTSPGQYGQCVQLKCQHCGGAICVHQLNQQPCVVAFPEILVLDGKYQKYAAISLAQYNLISTSQNWSGVHSEGCHAGLSRHKPMHAQRADTGGQRWHFLTSQWGM